jgi:hypothetical protein
LASAPREEGKTRKSDPDEGSTSVWKEGDAMRRLGRLSLILALVSGFLMFSASAAFATTLVANDIDNLNEIRVEFKLVGHDCTVGGYNLYSGSGNVDKVLFSAVCQWSGVGTINWRDFGTAPATSCTNCGGVIDCCVYHDSDVCGGGGANLGRGDWYIRGQGGGYIIRNGIKYLYKGGHGLNTGRIRIHCNA